MKKVILILMVCFLLGTPAYLALASDTKSTMELNGKDLGISISDHLYGLFYEDINFSADGGLYAELVYNRSFEYENIFGPTVYDGMTGWRLDITEGANGKLSLDSTYPLNEKNPQSLKVSVNHSGFKFMNVGHTKVINQNSAEMGIVEGDDYELSFYVFNSSYKGSLSFYLENKDGELISDKKTVHLKKKTDWKKISQIKLKGLQTTGGRLVIQANGVGEFNLDMVSLIPVNSYGFNDSKWKYSSLRPDLVMALKGLNPTFLRFPGGCVAEGAFSKDNHYNWKDTIGPMEYRAENPNLWGYMQSYGLGYHEYFQLAEDLGAEPVPVVHAGILCQARSGDLLPMYPNTEEFEQLTQDILDLIEYANGDASTEWGKKRADNGHKAPFDLKYIAIGNENWGAQYWNNFNALKKVIQQAYPEIKIITTAGPLSDGWIYDEAWKTVHLKHKDTIVDEHYYESPQWFLENTTRYDTYSRESAKVFVGEYAAHEPGGSVSRPNTLYSALAEAAYLTGIERNADVVEMISYAPLLARLGATQWMPDLIYFNAQEVLLTPNYYILQMFTNHIGTRYLLAKIRSEIELFQSVTVHEELEEIYIKLVNPTGDSTTLNISLSEFEALKPEAEVTVVWHENEKAVNSIKDPDNVVPEKSIVPVNEGSISLEIKPYSAQVIKLGYGKSVFKASLTMYPEQNDSSMVTIFVIGAMLLISSGTLGFWLLQQKNIKAPNESEK